MPLRVIKIQLGTTDGKRFTENPTRFEQCVESVAARGGAYDPKAVCAAAGRKKYGKRKFAAMAAAGRRRAARGRSNATDRPGRSLTDIYQPRRKYGRPTILVGQAYSGRWYFTVGDNWKEGHTVGSSGSSSGDIYETRAEAVRDGKRLIGTPGFEVGGNWRTAVVRSANPEKKTLRGKRK